MSYRGLGALGGPVDDLAQQVADYSGQLIEQQMVTRIPLVLDELRPQIRESAKDAMKYALADQQLQAALGQSIQNVKWYAALGVASTAVLTWLLVKTVDL